MTQLEIPYMPAIRPLPPLYAIANLTDADAREADYEALCAALDSLRGNVATLNALAATAHRAGSERVLRAGVGDVLRAMERIGREKVEVAQ